MVVLQQLPPPPAVFVDRDACLSWMDEECEIAWRAGRPACLALYGQAGVGVRSLVYQWYSQRSEWLPDGSLLVSLGDAGPGGTALVGDALADVLIDLGVRRKDLPSSVAGRTNMLRTRTYLRRLLLVIEEADNAAQVEPFLLNSPGSAVVVTSRSRLHKLEVNGFASKRVDEFGKRHSVELFERVLGEGWFSAARVAPESVAKVCGGFPLAIRATAAQIANAPEWEVADLIRDLASRGLGALEPESQEYVRDSFDRAYQRLPEDQARAYRLVAGLYPGATVFTDAASVLLDLPEERVRTLLAALAGAQLLTRVAADRFQYHDVAHWHAKHRAESDEPFPQQLAAVDRVVRWYLGQTIRRDRGLSERPRVGPGYRVLEPAPVPRGPALAWLEERRGNLRAVVALAERFQLPDMAWQMCEALWGVYHLHGHHEEWITTHGVGLDAAAGLGDPAAYMQMTSQLAAGHTGAGDLDRATELFGEAYRYAESVRGEAGARVAQSALEWLGKIATRQGWYDDAMGYYDRSWAVAASPEVPDVLRPRMFALLWLQRARTQVLAKAWDEARQAGRRAVDYFAGTSEVDNQAKSLLALAKAGAALGDATAKDVARQSAELFRADGSARGEVEALETVAALDPDADVRERLRELRDQLRGLDPEA